MRSALMHLVRCFGFLVSFIAAFAASWANAAEGYPLDNKSVFATIEIGELDSILQTTASEQFEFQDRLIRARGSFSVDDKEKIVNLLKAHGFQMEDGLLFTSGDDDAWWKLDGATKNELDLERSTPGQTDQFKLFEMKDGQGIFMFESADF